MRGQGREEQETRYKKITKEKARAYFLGKGRKKLNCAQAIAAAFGQEYGVNDSLIKSLASCSSGKAPGGICGSLHAAKVILQSRAPQIVEKCRQELIKVAGSEFCAQIRAKKQLSCLGCVEKIAEIISSF